MKCLFCERPASDGVRYVYAHAVESAQVHAAVCRACHARLWPKEKRQAWLQSMAAAAIVALMVYVIPSYITSTGLPTGGRVVLWIVFLFFLAIPIGPTIERLSEAYDRAKALERQVRAKLSQERVVRFASEPLVAEWLEKSVPTDPVRRAWELGKSGDANVVPQLIELSASTSVEVRRAATSSLEQLWWTASTEAIRRLIETLGDADAKVRATSALAIGEYMAKHAETSGGNAAAGSAPSNAARSALLARLSDPVDEVVTHAVVALANINDPDIAAPLARAVYERGLTNEAIELVSGLRPSKTRSAIVAELERLLQSHV